ncbi:hypothetical protein GGI22_007545 [Coemansia erecta]|nr:hypothetical protein GGI22_007545 [Coemansia erecta]
MEYLLVLHTAVAFAQRSVFAAYNAIAAGIDLGLPALAPFTALAQHYVFAAYYAIAAGAEMQFPRIFSAVSYYTGYDIAHSDLSMGPKLMGFFIQLYRFFCGEEQQAGLASSGYLAFIKPIYIVIGNWMRSVSNQCIKATGTASFFGQRNSSVDEGQYRSCIFYTFACIVFVLALMHVASCWKIHRSNKARVEKLPLEGKYLRAMLNLEVEQAKSRLIKKELDLLQRRDFEDATETVDITTCIDASDKILQNMDEVLKSTTLLIGEMKVEMDDQSSTPDKTA